MIDRKQFLHRTIERTLGLFGFLGAAGEFGVHDVDTEIDPDGITFDDGIDKFGVPSERAAGIEHQPKAVGALVGVVEERLHMSANLAAVGEIDRGVPTHP